MCFKPWLYPLPRRFLLQPWERNIESWLLLALAATSAAVCAAGLTAVAPTARSASGFDRLQLRGLCNGCYGQNEAEGKKCDCAFHGILL